MINIAGNLQSIWVPAAWPLNFDALSPWHGVHQWPFQAPEEHVAGEAHRGQVFVEIFEGQGLGYRGYGDGWVLMMDRY